MYVGMESEVPCPRVEHHSDAKLRAQALRVVSECKEGLRRTREQEIEHRLTRSLRNRAKLAGKGEDDMEVVCLQDPLDPSVDPPSLREGLALGAVPIATRVVRWLLVRALGAHVEVPAEHGGPALLDRTSVALSSGRSTRLLANASP
jgi:hypothetical protein